MVAELPRMTQRVYSCVLSCLVVVGMIACAAEHASHRGGEDLGAHVGCGLPALRKSSPAFARRLDVVLSEVDAKYTSMPLGMDHLVLHEGHLSFANAPLDAERLWGDLEKAFESESSSFVHVGCIRNQLLWTSGAESEYITTGCDERHRNLFAQRALVEHPLSWSRGPTTIAHLRFDLMVKGDGVYPVVLAHGFRSPSMVQVFQARQPLPGRPVLPLVTKTTAGGPSALLTTIPVTDPQRLSAYHRELYGPFLAASVEKDGPPELATLVDLAHAVRAHDRAAQARAAWRVPLSVFGLAAVAGGAAGAAVFGGGLLLQLGGWLAQTPIVGAILKWLSGLGTGWKLSAWTSALGVALVMVDATPAAAQPTGLLESIGLASCIQSGRPELVAAASRLRAAHAAAVVLMVTGAGDVDDVEQTLPLLVMLEVARRHGPWPISPAEAVAIASDRLMARLTDATRRDRDSRPTQQDLERFERYLSQAVDEAFASLAIASEPDPKGLMRPPPLPQWNPDRPKESGNIPAAGRSLDPSAQPRGTEGQVYGDREAKKRRQARARGERLAE